MKAEVMKVLLEICGVGELCQPCSFYQQSGFNAVASSDEVCENNSLSLLEIYST